MRNQIINESIMLKEIYEQPERIRESLSKNMSVIKTIAKRINELEPSMICFAGRGSSEHACITAKYLFETLARIPSVMLSPSVVTVYESGIEYKNCVAIGVSQCGEAQDVAETLTSIRKCGGLTIAITNTPGSLVDASAEYTLYCEAGEEKCVTATKSYTTQLALMTALAAYVSGNECLLNEYPRLADAVEEALKLEKEVVKLLGYYRLMDHVFLLSRGYSLGVIAEAELKIQETSCVRAMAYSTADYSHGPIAMATSSSPFLFVAVDRHTDHNIEELYHKISKKSVLCACITNKPELAEKFPLSVLLPDWCEGMPGCFAAATIFQIFASYLSVLLGCDPDNPVGLGKVTVTR